MPEKLRFTLPLKDIKTALDQRIKMLEKYEKMAVAAVKKSQGVVKKAQGAAKAVSKETAKKNQSELDRIRTKMKRLQETRALLMTTCCPEVMDCEHELTQD